MKNKFFKILSLALIAIFSVTLFVGCDQAETVNHNIQTDANKFNIYRRMTFVNLYTDKVLYDVEGYFALKTTYDNTYQGQQEIGITILTGKDQYQLHYFSIANNVTYVIEQIEPTHEDPYFWKINWYVALPDNVKG